MQKLLALLLLFHSLPVVAQVDWKKPFRECKLEGSITLYDYKKQQWLYSDTADAQRFSQPASTFKVLNLLISLETGVIKDEKEIIRWPGITDTVLYGYRPEIYRDMTVQEAFEVSAGWVFIELAKKIGREKYSHYLALCNYGNGNLSEKGHDFWSFGAFGVTPQQQVSLLVKLYENKLPFAVQHLETVKKVMITEKQTAYTIRAKTGWTRVNGLDSGWWIGYVERPDNSFFFATRIYKKREVPHPGFGDCRKIITKAILSQLEALEQKK